MANDPVKPIVLTLRYPISANRYWQQDMVRVKDPKKLAANPRLKRTDGWMQVTKPSAEAVAYIEEVRWRALQAGIRKPLTGRIKLECLLYPQRPKDYLARMRKHGEHWDDDVRCIDLGNANKVLEDALKGTVYVDDKWTWRLFMYRMEPDDAGARVVVRITQLLPQARQAPLL